MSGHGNYTVAILLPNLWVWVLEVVDSSGSAAIAR